MNTKLSVLLIILVFIAGFLIGQIYSNVQQSGVLEPKQNAVVTKVIDGDTIVVEGGAIIRLIGINTPEKGEPFYSEAKDYLEEKVFMKEVNLESDIENKDQYERYLRYVWINSSLVHNDLLREGLASVMTYEPNTKHASEFIQAEQEAKENKKGLWA